MAIRIRDAGGWVVALCAAETSAQPGDLYLDDSIHHALTTKFALDFGLPESADPVLVALAREQEATDAQ